MRYPVVTPNDPASPGADASISAEQHYKAALVRARIPSHQMPHYLRWVHHFRRWETGSSAPPFLPIAPPIDPAASLQEFLAHLQSDAPRPGWQIDQITRALHLYFHCFFSFDPTNASSFPPPSADQASSMPVALSQAPPPQEELLTSLSRLLRTRHYSRRTEEAYVHWCRRFFHFHHPKQPAELGENDIRQFLSHLANEKEVAASTQTQALSALLFLYQQVLGMELKDLGCIDRAKAPKKLPVVLTREEIRSLFAQMTGLERLLVELLYGSGMRILEALRLRVKDLDFTTRQILIRDGKGAKDRVTVLPQRLIERLQLHLQTTQAIYEQDRLDGLPGCYLPNALERKYPSANKEWCWQWVFPAQDVSQDPRSNLTRRHHLRPEIIQRAVRRAVHQAGITKHATPHTLRHSITPLTLRLPPGHTFYLPCKKKRQSACVATHLLQAGSDIRTVQHYRRLAPIANRAIRR